MLLSIKDLLSNDYQLNGDILLFRTQHTRKYHLCEYISSKITVPDDVHVHVCTCGAFGLAIAKKYPNNIVEIMGNVSPEYKQQFDLLPNVRYAERCTHEDAVVLNQYNNPLVLEHYASFFPAILEEVKDKHIDAFCDCGHTCGCFAGLMKSNLKPEWKWILGITNKLSTGHRKGNPYIATIPNRDEILYSVYENYDTKELQTKIESAYPSFGNVFEATRSISAAMNWLSTNPGKTVLVYVGDSPVFGG